MRKSVVIVAGGSGSRMKSSVPKQFIVIKGKPLLMHTIIAFYNYSTSIDIVLVLPEQHIELWKELVLKYEFDIPHKIVEGGEERFYSVKNGLDIVDTDLVAIHDAVRPFVSNNIIEEAFKLAELNGSAIPVIPVNESIRLLTNDNCYPIDRNTVMLVQTPECFKTELIKKAFEMPYKTIYTDCSSVFEAMGEKVYLITGNEFNIKITKPIDLLFAEVILKNRSKLNF